MTLVIRLIWTSVTKGGTHCKRDTLSYNQEDILLGSYVFCCWLGVIYSFFSAANRKCHRKGIVAKIYVCARWE
jgi:hypothetical protein